MSRRARARVWERTVAEGRDVIASVGSVPGATRESVFWAIFQWAWDSGLTAERTGDVVSLVLGPSTGAGWLAWVFKVSAKSARQSAREWAAPGEGDQGRSARQDAEEGVR